MHITIRVTGSKEVSAKLKRLGDNVLRLRPEMEHIGSDLKKYYAGQGFTSQGGVYGARWSPLRTNAWKAKHYPGRQPLVRTGRMQKSFKHTATQSGVTIENTAPYFKYHQSSAPRTIMPYRPMMGINTAVTGTIKKRIQDGIRRNIDAAGL